MLLLKVPLVFAWKWCVKCGFGGCVWRSFCFRQVVYTNCLYILFIQFVSWTFNQSIKKDLAISCVYLACLILLNCPIIDLWKSAVLIHHPTWITKNNATVALTYKVRSSAIKSAFFLEHLHSAGSKSIANIQSNNSELTFFVFVLSLILSPHPI